MNRYQENIIRKICALGLIAIVICAFLLAIREDYKLKDFEKFLSLGKIGLINYVVKLNSIDLNTETVRGVLSVEPGIPIWDNREHTVLYGPLSYSDVTYTYVAGIVPLEIYLLRSRSVSGKVMSKSPPSSIDISIRTLARLRNLPI